MRQNDQIPAQEALHLYFGRELGDTSEVVIFTPARGDLDRFKQFCSQIGKDFSGWVARGFSGRVGSRDVTVVCPGVGSSQFGDATIAAGYGSCRVAIMVGSIGGLKDGMAIGDIIVAEEAVIGEGFSRYHLGDCPSEDAFGRVAQADYGLVDCAWELAKRKAEHSGIRCHRGRIFTTESLFAEPEHFLQEIVLRGCIGIEKEVSAFFTAARAGGITAAALLCISDLPLHQKSLFAARTRHEEEKRIKVRHQLLPRIALELAECVGNVQNE